MQLTTCGEYDRPWRPATLALLSAALVLVGARADAQSGTRTPTTASAGIEACAECHPLHASAVGQSIHGRLTPKEWLPAGASGCEACHGSAVEHAAAPKFAPDVPRLGDLPVRQQNAVCSACHRGSHLTQLQGSAHGRDLACIACHDPHKASYPAMLRGPQLEMCGSCHVEQAARFRFPSHHPVGEGKMQCSDCHLAHGGTHKSLREEEGNALCFRCHAALQGPFLYDHPPVVEDCAICHEPHGTVANNLLVQSEPYLCMMCHGAHENFARAAGSREDWIPAFLSKCSQCHPAVHGTDFVAESGKNRMTR